MTAKANDAEIAAKSTLYGLGKRQDVCTASVLEDRVENYFSFIQASIL